MNDLRESQERGPTIQEYPCHTKADKELSCYHMYDGDAHISAKTDVLDFVTSCWSRNQSSPETGLAELGVVEVETYPSGTGAASGEVAGGQVEGEGYKGL